MGALLAVLLAVVLVAAQPAAAPAATKRAKVSPRLQAFSSCASLVRYARSNAARTDGTTGVPTRAVGLAPQIIEAPLRRSGEAVPAPLASPQKDAAGGGSTPAFSQTNAQEIGVDEPDAVKTDGRRLLAITGGTLRAFDVSGPAPRLVGSLALEGAGQQMLVRGDRVLVLASSGGFVIQDQPAVVSPAPRARASIAPDPGTPTAILTEIDAADPAAMRVRRTMTLDGTIVDARLTGAAARIVVSSSPRPLQAPAQVSTWVPRTVLRSKVSGRTIRRAVVGCRAVRRPLRFSGLDLTTVLTVNLDQGLFAVDRDAIMAGADTVYASPGSLYVASRRWSPAVEAGRAIPGGVRTQIHRFDAAGSGATAYRSSGEVEGFVLNQYAMSEFEGRLRVATTTEPQWFEGRRAEDTQSYVTVLAERGRALAPLGRVGGLGRGERIYAVRFQGDKGYVVTFRQVDPLYTVDLADPARPVVAGELKIQGYSAYLHPVSDTLLLGIGQDATPEGRTLGTQLSLFDVSDLRRPRRVAQARLGQNTTSDAEFDPHAFLYWAPTRLALLPLEGYGTDTAFSGAVGFRVGGAALAEAGRIAHPAQDGAAPPVARTVVVGERIYSLSYAGLQSSRLDTLAPVGFAAIAP